MSRIEEKPKKDKTTFNTNSGTSPTLRDFLRAFRPHDEPVWIRALPGKIERNSRGIEVGKKPRNIDDAPELVKVRPSRVEQDKLASLNDVQALYFHVNIGAASWKTKKNSQGKEYEALTVEDSDITEYVAVFVENDNLTIGEQQKRLDAFQLPPSIRVVTKKSVHAYWLFETPIKDEQTWRQLQARLIQHFDGDKKNKNPSRLMRLPFFDHLTWSRKGELQRQLVTLDSFAPSTRYSVKQLDAALPQLLPSEKKTSQARQRRPNKAGERAAVLLDGEPWAKDDTGKVTHGRHNFLAHCIGGLVKDCSSKEQAIEEVIKIDTKTCEPPLRDDAGRWARVTDLVERTWLSEEPYRAKRDEHFGECSRLCDEMAVTTATSEKSEKKPVKKNELVKLAEDVELFCEPHGNSDKAYATLPVNGHHETYRINSNEFRLWLTNEFYKKYQQAVSSQPKQDAISTLESRAFYEGKRHSVFIRVGELDGKFYYDLGDEQWRVVEIDSTGWRILDRLPVKFIRPAAYKAQAIPVKGGDIQDLRQFINVASDDDWVLFLSWLISSFRPTGPYALLSLAGTQDAAKSTTTKMIRLLVDPSKALVRQQPKEERDLMVGAKNNWLLAFDNLSYLSEVLSDALCRVSTGGGQASRQNYTDGEEYVFDVMRPVVMNGIEELATRPDLADRTMNIFLPSLKDEQRKDEKTLYTEYERALPRILGSIFTIVSAAIKNLPQVKLKRLPRLADVAKFVQAAEPALGWKEGTFLKAYESYRHEARISALESSFFGSAIQDLMDDRDRWSGNATELLEELFERRPNNFSKKNFPYSPRGATGMLRRLIPNLKEVGIEVELPEKPEKVKGKAMRVIRLTNTQRRKLSLAS